MTKEQFLKILLLIENHKYNDTYLSIYESYDYDFDDEDIFLLTKALLNDTDIIFLSISSGLMTDKGVEALASIKHLESLSLNCSKLTYKVLDNLLDINNSLKEIHIDHAIIPLEPNEPERPVMYADLTKFYQDFEQMKLIRQQIKQEDQEQEELIKDAEEFYDSNTDYQQYNSQLGGDSKIEEEEY